MVANKGYFILVLGRVKQVNLSKYKACLVYVVGFRPTKAT